MKRVLIVDDTKNIRILLTKCLELDGYSVVTANDGQEALELFKKDSFDLAFLDIKMPSVSGTEVLKRIREQGIDTPVIIITAYATIKNAVECTQMGAVAYLQKPFTSDKIRTVLNELLSQDCKGSVELKNQSGNLTGEIEGFLDRGDFSRALSLLKTVISNEPSDPYVYLLLSRAYRGAGDLVNSEKFRKIHEILKA